LGRSQEMLKDDKHKKLIVYCRSGSRSVTASRILKERGFTPINVNGGIIQLMVAGVVLVR